MWFGICCDTLYNLPREHLMGFTVNYAKAAMGHLSGFQTILIGITLNYAYHTGGRYKAQKLPGKVKFSTPNPE